MEKGNIIAAIVGPKGGVGKTTICASLSIALSRLGKKVVAVDLDLGASNLHAIFGLRFSNQTLDDFVQNRIRDLSDIVVETESENVALICGGDIPGIANLHYQKKQKLIRHLSWLDCDIVLLDLAPGASFNVADFSIIARKVLLVTTGEVPSLMNLYSFMKAALFRRLNFLFKQRGIPDLMELLERARDHGNHPHLKTMNGFLVATKEIDRDTADAVNAILSELKPFLIINRVRSKNDIRAGEVMKKMLCEFLNIENPVIMTIREDAAVASAVARMKPVILEAPTSPFAVDIEAIARKVCR